MKNPRIEKPKRQISPSHDRGHRGPPNMSAPWGRGASDHRPGIFIKHYLLEHRKSYAADTFTALNEELRRLNQERVEIGEKPIKGCTYNSFAKYWHWFLLLGLIERTGKLEPAVYNFLQKRVFYKLTDKGKAEIRSWEDPIAVVHPEFRSKT